MEEFKEINIVHAVVFKILKEQEFVLLKKYLVSEKAYQAFLVKLLEIIIGQEKNLSLNDFFALHGLPENASKFGNKIPDILEEIAELVFKGYTSVYTKWLVESKNEIFLNHLSFLNDLGMGIAKSERDSLKNNFSTRRKIDELEISDQEIRIGFKLLERKRLKERFEELDLKNRIPQVKAKSPRRLKYSTIFILLAISSFALAISIPSVRTFIVQQVKEIFNINEPSQKNTNNVNTLKTGLVKKTEKDTISLNEECNDSVSKVTPKPDSTTHGKDTDLKKIKPRIGNINRLHNEKDYDNYFLENINNLEYLEGVWLFQGIFSKDYYGYNATKIKFAIVKNGNRYEMAWLNRNGTQNSKSSQFYLIRLPEEKGVYSLIEYVHSKEISHTRVYINNKTHTLSFEININAERFEFPNASSGEMIHCKFTGVKQDTHDL